jgi:hypothetical protein
MAKRMLLECRRARAGGQDDFAAGVGVEEPLDEPADEPPDDAAELLDFSAGLAAGVESDFDSALAAVFSAEREFDFPLDSARESLR